jgi:putative heme iron utilization protein
MTDKAFDPESERFMIDYMNQGHPGPLLMYAKAYGNLWDAEAAYMVALDKEGMELNVEVPEGEKRIRIPFDHCLEDDSDAQNTLVEMSMQAREMVTQRRQQQRAE